MTRNNADFVAGLHHAPQPAGSEFAPKHEGEKLYHGSPAEITDGVIKPGQDERAWATDQPKEATVYGKYAADGRPIHVYEVKPIDSKEIVGVYGPRFHKGNLVKHFHSGKGFTVVRKLDPKELE